MSRLTITFDQAKLTELYQRLDRATANGTLVPPVTRGAARIRRDLATYPRPSYGRKNPPRTVRQRRFLAALGRRGGIPYRRTGNLGRSWVDDVEVLYTGVRATIGNAVRSRTAPFAAYGPLVQGEGTQAAIHKGIWQTDADVFTRDRDIIVDDVMGAIDYALS